MPGNAVLSVGNLWGNAAAARTCGISVGRADALLSLLTMVRNRAVASATLGPLGETQAAAGHDLAAGAEGSVRGPPETTPE